MRLPISVKRALRILLLLLLLFEIALMSHAQGRTQKRIDSLRRELTGVYDKKDDTNKVNLLERLSYLYYAVDPDSGIMYARQEYDIANKLGWKKGEGGAYRNLGVNYQYKSEFDTALSFFEKALTIYKSLSYKKELGTTYGNIGFCYTIKGEFDKAIENDEVALKIFEETGDKPGIANNLGNISSIYVNKAEFSRALEYAFKALKMNEELGNKTSMASNFGTIGSIYNRQGKYAKALEYYDQAVELNKELGNKFGLAGNYANMGTAYLEKDQSKGLEYFFRAVRMYEELGAKKNLAIIYGNIGQIYSEQHNHTEAVGFIYRSLELAQEMGDKHLEAGQLGNLGECYLSIVLDTFNNSNIIVSQEVYVRPFQYSNLIPKNKTALLKNAQQYIKRAVETEIEVGDLYYLYHLYQNLSTTDSLLGDYKGALDAYQRSIFFKDSIYNDNNEVKIANLETKRERDLKNKQIEINKLVVEKKRNEQILFTAGIGLLLLVIVVVMRNYSFQKRSNLLLSKEKQRSEDLLLNILPAEVAEELKYKGSAAAKYYDDVTVLFTDFVNFTQAGERMNHQELIDELDTCFKAFDQIIGKYGVEKIKTIGDAYLAVAGLPRPDSNHGINVTRAAIEIRDFMTQRRKMLGDKTFEVRIGLHSGSVIAGIVGVKKFAYDIWGDTVNTAARMQQSSEPGKINISDTTYEIVKNKVACEYRGQLDAKNKGQLKMYFVISEL